MKRTSVEVISKIKEILADKQELLTDARVIELYEDISDSILETNVDYKAEYEKLNEESEKKIKEIEETWKQKYIDRFTNPQTTEEEKDKIEKNEEIVEKVNFSDLFESEVNK